MSIFSHLDIIIQEHSKSEAEYKRLRGEINKHLKDKLSYKHLSRKAKKVLAEWESIYKISVMKGVEDAKKFYKDSKRKKM